jgi:hypothetical protein
MYYIGSHVGTATDIYTSSSSWLNGELRFRPKDFRRRILAQVPVTQLRKQEYRILKMIKPDEFGVRYYNIKAGKPKGHKPWNKGKKTGPSEVLKKALRGRPAWNKGIPNEKSADNARKSAKKLSATTAGRKMIEYEGTRTWAYPQSNGEWLVKLRDINGTVKEIFIPSPF